MQSVAIKTGVGTVIVNVMGLKQPGTVAPRNSDTSVQVLCCFQTLDVLDAVRVWASPNPA